MFIRKKKTWAIPEKEATQEEVYLGRRKFLSSAGYLSLGGLLLSGLGSRALSIFGDGGEEEVIKLPSTHSSSLYPAARNNAYRLDRPLTAELAAASYTNFYEFSSGKEVWRHIEGFKARPWMVEITGLVEKPLVLGIDELVRRMPLEERLYRHRCVEAWAMAVPWTGFPLRDLLRLSRPLSSAKFVVMTSFMAPDIAPRQKLDLPWPYTEGLTIEEAANELAFMATGIYGHELPAQHGAPIRLVVPWKYGFKSIKSIVKIEFASGRPATFWNTLAPDEFGFTANVNPDLPQKRWSQKTEWMLGTKERRPTLIYNGYGEAVSGEA